MLAYFVSLGLTLPDALTLQTQLLTQVLGFVLSVDVTADRVAAHERARLLDPVPASWLTAFPDLDAPNVRAAAAADPVSPDEMFERILDGIIRGLEPLIIVSADQAEHSLPDEETMS